ncbi:hypothetical protein N431DRAFT_425797 [Stipitochalara longipes BDJ]|nr:hypothetical protein N431DRAFT_425797 [Stipitochalara longipes BDJ]
MRLFCNILCCGCACGWAVLLCGLVSSGRLSEEGDLHMGLGGARRHDGVLLRQMLREGDGSARDRIWIVKRLRLSGVKEEEGMYGWDGWVDG